MVHARVSESYIHFSFIYTADHVFPNIPIKDLINEDTDPTTPYELATGMKPTVLKFTRVILSMCCIESYCTRWNKGIKYASPSTKRLSQVLRS